MNLFLLAAAPLFAVVVHLAFFRSRPPFALPQAWFLGTAWSVLALVVATPLGLMRVFDGNLWLSALGLTVTDAAVVPGVVILAWFLTRRREAWELGLWLAIVFSMAGLRDFASSTRTFDMNELFLVPLDRLLLMITLPTLHFWATRVTVAWKRIALWSLGGALVLTGAGFQILSFAGWGWLVWILELAGILAGCWALSRWSTMEARGISGAREQEE